MDQSQIIDPLCGGAATVTSAMHGYSFTIQTVLQAVIDESFDRYGGKVWTLGLDSKEPFENFVHLSKSTAFNEGFTMDDYASLVEKMYSGQIALNESLITEKTFPQQDDYTNVTIKYYDDFLF